VDPDLTLEEAVVAGLLLLFLTHFYIPILDPVQSTLFAASSEDQTALGQAVNVGVWVIACGWMLHGRRVLLASWQSVPWIVAFAGFAVISAAWSQDAGITLRKGIFLLLTTAFGIYFGRRFTVPRQMHLICIAALVASFLSIVFAVGLPKYGIDHDVHEGVWLGIFTQKNVCAREMLFLLATVLPYQPGRLISRWLRAFTLPAVVAVVIGTRSKTALLILLALLAFFLAMVLYRKVSRGVVVLASIAALTLAVMLLSLAASSLPRLAALIGRDGTMTGRTQIWQAVFEAIQKHPILGYGFSAFWLSLRGESANIILTLRWAVPAAHNGFLDIWLQLGVAGLVLFAVGFLIALRAALGNLRDPDFARAAWPLAILLLTFVYNLDESSLMQPNDFLWVVYVATLSNLSIHQSRYRYYDLRLESTRPPHFPLLPGAP